MNGTTRSFLWVFNLVLGIICILIGFKVYKPFNGDDGEMKFQKVKTFYRLGGIALVIFGLIKIFNS